MVRRPVVGLALAFALVAASCSAGPVALPWPGSSATRAGLPECTSSTTSRPAAPQPVAGHPRLWITAADLPRLRSWASGSNPVYARGLAVLAGSVKDAIRAGKIPWSDSGSREYEDYPTEAIAAFFAFLSLVSPDQPSRDYYARSGRALLMHVMALPAQRAVVLFPNDLGPAVTTLTYSVPTQLAPAAGAARHFITGLQPNARYDVQVTGGHVTIRPGGQVQADPGGVLVIGG